jgi:hypothetical protein
MLQKWVFNCCEMLWWVNIFAQLWEFWQGYVFWVDYLLLERKLKWFFHWSLRFERASRVDGKYTNSILYIYIWPSFCWQLHSITIFTEKGKIDFDISGNVNVTGFCWISYELTSMWKFWGWICMREWKYISGWKMFHDLFIPYLDAIWNCWIFGMTLFDQNGISTGALFSLLAVMRSKLITWTNLWQ